MTKITQKNYEAIKIYRQKEKLFELKGKIQTLESENTKLKSLLKECRRYIDIWGCDDTHCRPLLPQIDQVLGEE